MSACFMIRVSYIRVLNNLVLYTYATASGYLIYLMPPLVIYRENHAINSLGHNNYYYNKPMFNTSIGEIRVLMVITAALLLLLIVTQSLPQSPVRILQQGQRIPLIRLILV